MRPQIPALQRPATTETRNTGMVKIRNTGFNLKERREHKELFGCLSAIFVFFAVKFFSFSFAYSAYFAV